MTEKSISRKSRYKQRFDEALLPTGSNYFENNHEVTENLREAMYSDDLTGLLNRRGFRKEVRFMQERLILDEPDGYIAIVSCDLDDFKGVNDTFGHDTGDEVLKSVADIIKHSVRDDDVVARWGGDEFVVAMALHHSFDDVKPADVARGFDIDIKKRFQEAIAAGNPHLGLIGISSGVEIGKASDLEGIKALLDAADVQMYDRKSRADTKKARSAGAAALSLSRPAKAGKTGGVIVDGAEAV